MWIGLEALHQLTYSASYELRVDMVDYQLGPKYAHYKVFRVGPESDGYRLLVTNYSGNAGDALSRFHSGRRFSTLDRDQDLARNKSCARDKEGGWWFHACYAAHPNGRHPTTPSRKSNSTEIRWWTNRETVLVLTHIEMKIRRLRPHGTPDEDWATSDDAALGDEDDNYESTLSPEEEGQSEPVDYEAWWKTPWVGTDGGDIPGNDSFWGNEGRSDISPWEVTRRN
ncbi:fibrinogen C domain-containing protein 1-like [Homarus americanus]|nr:fibrinogen C domain-containing protein 1-like [Homarus americanus]